MSIQRVVILSAVVVSSLSAAQLRAADSEVSGVFKGNDQPAKLMFVSAHEGTPVADKDTIKLVFTEKNHVKDERPELEALLGGYGSVIMVGIMPAGLVVTGGIAHEALKEKAISSP